MTLLLGVTLGLGLLLVVAPALWPRPARLRIESRLVDLARVRLVQAGLGRVSVPTFLVVSALLAVAASAVVFTLVPVVALAIAAGIVALVLPFALVRSRARSRRRAARVVWPDVVDHLVSAVRSGLALPDSVVTLARAGPETTRSAFAAFEADYRATGNFSLSLTQLKDRLADPVADRLIETLRMSREVGGSELTHVLRNLAVYLRNEAAIRSEVEARQSWVVNAARLGVAAPWIVLLLLSTRPEAAAAYNTAAGAVLVTAGLALSVVAYRIMIAVGRIPEQQRWFR
ncbi:tight adherence protein B [Conyzicola lurida]|uniref:Tight adherence protein B n=1 Tax=Conyzicola lurida TaxID=1172621 RepID=A0A841ALF5_9MICO|nr:type II secretion system F family protein [Conyzicola lurida]MBB5842536.1 tight adherence protein B [Conyzicola lurida]